MYVCIFYFVSEHSFYVFENTTISKKFYYVSYKLYGVYLSLCVYQTCFLSNGIRPSLNISFRMC